ncbi:MULTISPECIES: hypothetical protein [Flavobacteriaceae]|uniref:hypothetical protein n=1 Tax=Flavobacteriaceae TaxID=49546 RepID=UPI001492160A|nr:MULTISPECIES: hypothetical protein [Allomuricauda]MDC6365207.1 hypothetical protein [Muricauda sp. AC10]
MDQKALLSKTESRKSTGGIYLSPKSCIRNTLNNTKVFNRLDFNMPSNAPQEVKRAFMPKPITMQGTIDFMIYDKQGPMSNAIKHVLKNTEISIHRLKKVSEIKNTFKKRTTTNFIFIMFVFNEVFEFMDYLELETFGVPIVFAPTNKRCYERLCEIEHIWVMDVSRNKQEYIQQINDFLDILQPN